MSKKIDTEFNSFIPTIDKIEGFGPLNELKHILTSCITQEDANLCLGADFFRNPPMATIDNQDVDLCLNFGALFQYIEGMPLPEKDFKDYDQGELEAYFSTIQCSLTHAFLTTLHQGVFPSFFKWITFYLFKLNPNLNILQKTDN